MTVQPGPQISERSIVVQKVGAISGQAFTAVAARASAPSAAIPPTSASPTTHSLRFIIAILPFEKGDLHYATSDPRPRQSEEAALVADDSRAHKATRQVRECDRRSRKCDKEDVQALAVDEASASHTTTQEHEGGKSTRTRDSDGRYGCASSS